jgi:tyrosinase
MADHTSHGTASAQRLALTILDTVLIFRNCFFPGTGRTWRSTRLVSNCSHDEFVCSLMSQQVLYSHIVAAVNEFPAGATRNRYAQAALSWRHPYWDWAAQPSDGQSVLPTSMSSPTVNVIMPNGSTTIANPLYAYRFHPVSMEDFYYQPVSPKYPQKIIRYTKANCRTQWGYWNTSLRAPNTDDPDAFSQDSAIGPILDNSRISFRDRLYNLFTFYGNYSEFSTESYNFGGEFKNADSLESIHDVIHGATGSGGHMTYLDYSAYDPIFWLHHMMVDRAFALWQAVYPDSYVEPNQAWTGSYTIPERAPIDMDTRRSLPKQGVFPFVLQKC